MIWLPSALPERERALVILHEQQHIRRGDHIFRFLAWCALCLHWFNPLVWLAFWLSGRDMESACDEAVLREADSVSFLSQLQVFAILQWVRYFIITPKQATLKI